MSPEFDGPSELASNAEWWEYANELSKKRLGFSAEEFVKQYRNNGGQIIEGDDFNSRTIVLMAIPEECLKPQPLDLSVDWYLL